MDWMKDAMTECALGREDGFGDAAEQIEKAVNAVGASAMHIGALGGQGQLKTALVAATPFLRMLGTVQLALEAVTQARVAKRVIAERGSTPHLESKALNLAFYVAHVLPNAVALSKTVRSSDDSCLSAVLFQ
jgi:hypothetical protein